MQWLLRQRDFSVSRGPIRTAVVMVLCVAALVVVQVSGTPGNQVAQATAETCANGGECRVGDVGPGGGTVFYVHSSGTFACGVNLASTCRYLESAPVTGPSNWTDSKYVFSGNTTSLVPDQANVVQPSIGAGRRNTDAFVAQNSTANRAVTITRAYRGPNDKDDWFLPSSAELDELYAQRALVGGFFEDDWYWSSHGCCSKRVNGRHFGNGAATSSAFKTSSYYVRPIRAFNGSASLLTVSFDAQGGSAVASESSSVGGQISAPSDSTTRAGFTLTGWFTASSGGTAITFPYAHGQTADFTLYAQWVQSSLYVVSFDGNGSTGGSVPSDQTKTHGVDLTVASNSGSLVREGFTFVGWNSQADGDGTAYAEGATYTTDVGLTLYAQWTGDPLTVTYDAQGGSAVSDGLSVSGGSVAEAPDTPIRAGFTFVGWFVASIGGAAVSFPYPHGQNADFTLYAQWTLNTYVVSFDGNGSTGGSVPSD
ncbi:MAG: InlB B-repeat-containing protein, partial [Ilumatobacteraceae bacterium]